MTNTNDERILAMKKKIEEKKEQIAKAKKFTPLTNCSLDFKGQRINLHTLNITSAKDLIVDLTVLKLAVKELDWLDSYIVSGYLLTEWISDVKSKIELLSLKEEEQKLKKMESTLEAMLSEEKQKELMLDEIEALL